MKRMYILVLAMLLLIPAMTGCGAQETTQVTEPGPVVVTNVDELLAAIAPGAQIRMEEGNYDLSEAADYGAAPEGAFYSWVMQEGGCQLMISGVQGLSICGSAEGETSISTAGSFTDILTLKDCADVVLEDLTFGREEPGGGLRLLSCEKVMLNRLNLTMAGTAGLMVENCRDLTVTESRISDCGFAGIHAVQTDELTVENCLLQELGNTEYGGSSVFRLAQASNVTVTGCEIRDNGVESLVDCYPCDNVVFTGNTITRNQFHNAVFDVDGGLVFDNNAFEQNNVANWFASERSTVLDGIGKSWNGEMLQWYYHPPVETVPEGTRAEIHVATADELLAAIGPNTEIILDAEFFDLSTAKDYGTGSSEFYYWSEEFDGPSLIISDVDNLTIRSAYDNVESCTISAVPRYAQVLSFRRCSNITLFGFTAGHTVEPGYCMGGVLYFRGCDNVLVENCGLYGCGILGVQAELSGGITVKDCDIYECSYGGIQMAEVMGAVIENCTFRDLGGDSMMFYDCKDVTVDGTAVAGNTSIG